MAPAPWDTPTVKVLFLDIDGVLNSEEWARTAKNLADLDEVAVKRVLNIIAITGATLVLSSTWRLVPELVELLRTRGLPIQHQTPRFAAFGTRNKEIEAWLAEHPEVDAFAIVDDDEDAGYGLAPHFVQTDFRVGLTAEQAHQIVRILGVYHE